jgi:hypothetical protein
MNTNARAKAVGKHWTKLDTHLFLPMGSKKVSIVRKLNWVYVQNYNDMHGK